MNLNTFFQSCVYFIMVLLVFTLVLNFVDATGAFPVEDVPGQQDLDESNALETLTGLDDPTMQGVFLLGTSIAAIASITLAIATRQVAPIGVYLFGQIFWTSYIKMNSIVSTGGFIPSELLTVFFVATLFLFSAAVIGMFTGSG